MDARAAGSFRRRDVLRALSGFALASFAFNVRSQGISRRPVRFLIAQSSGTTPDTIARLVAARLQERWDQPFFVENRPGASGAIGMAALAKSPPDGHTIAVVPETTLTLPYFYRNLSFDVLKSFQPITFAGSSNFALVVHSSVPVNNLAEFIAYAKARPGKLSYGSPGMGTFHHLCMELLKQSTGIDIVHVPYKAAAGSVSDLVAGQIAATILPIGQALALQKGGKVKVLGGTRRERHPLYPDVPSLHELGVRGYDGDPWYGIWGPAGMPANLVEKYNAELRDILVQPDVRGALAKAGLVTKPGSPEELAQMAKAQYEAWGEVVRAAKITAE